MDLAASVSPVGTSNKALAVKRAKNGIAATLKGTMAAVVPRVVPTKNRVTGMRIMSKIIKGTERPILIITSKITNVLRFSRIRPLSVKNAKNPIGSPTKTAMAVAASPI